MVKRKLTVKDLLHKDNINGILKNIEEVAPHIKCIVVMYQLEDEKNVKMDWSISLEFGICWAEALKRQLFKQAELEGDA